MEINMRDTSSQIIEIEDDVIDLDEADRTPEEVIYEWDAKVRKKMSMFAVADNENILGDLMKEYLQSLQEMASSYEDSETLKHKVFCHIGFLYSYSVELQCCAPESYLNNMEDILTLYCNLELNVIHPLKKKDLSKHKYKRRIVSVTRRIIYMLTVYLLEHHDHILHVLIKMNTPNQVSDPCSEVLNVLYTHFLTKVPAFNLCDESFCRNYVAFQKWKEIRNIEDWGGMDKIMYKMFKRTPETIQKNDMLRQILMPICHEEVDIISNVFCSYRGILKAYFKHVMAKTNVEIDDLDFDIDLGEDEPTVPVNDEDEEEVQFLKVYYEVERHMSNLSHLTDKSEVDIFRKCKEEIEDDDDVQFVNITMLQTPSLVHVTSDNEDSDHRMSNEDPPQLERLPVPTPPVLLNELNEKHVELESPKGVNRICVGTPRTVPEESDSCQTGGIQTVIEPVEQTSCLVNSLTTSYNVATETNQPEVSFDLNNTVPCPFISTSAVATACDHIPSQETVAIKSVEVQADNLHNFVYNDYGLTTPPFDVPIDDQLPTHIEPRLYTNISQHKKDLSSEKRNICATNTVPTRAVQVQVDSSNNLKNCPYNDYGLTPPNDTHIEDFNSRLQGTCVYTNIGHKDVINGKIEENFSDCGQINSRHSEISENIEVTQETIGLNSEHDFNETLPNRTSERVTQDYEETRSNVPYIRPQSEYDEFEDHFHASEMNDMDAEDDGENVTINSCHSSGTNVHLIPDKGDGHTEPLDISRKNPDFQISLESRSRFKTNDHIDTGQKMFNATNNIKPVIEAKDQQQENYNGNILVKSLVSLSRTNGQAKDVHHIVPTKIVHPSMHEYNNFDEILSGPISKIVPTKYHNFFNSQDIYETESISKPSSVHEIRSPCYEGMEDFAEFYKEKSFKQKKRVTFDDENIENSRIREKRDLKHIIDSSPRVKLQRMPYLESAIKRITSRTSVIRVDYDKTRPEISNTDRVSFQCPPKEVLELSFRVTSNNSIQGSLTVKNRVHLEKKPKKRKIESQNNFLDEPANRKRSFRTAKKISLATQGGRGVRRTRSSRSSENNFVSKSVSEFDKLLNSEAYSNKPFRLDLTS